MGNYIVSSAELRRVDVFVRMAGITLRQSQPNWPILYTMPSCWIRMRAMSKETIFVRLLKDAENHFLTGAGVLPSTSRSRCSRVAGFSEGQEGITARPRRAPLFRLRVHGLEGQGSSKSCFCGMGAQASYAIGVCLARLRARQDFWKGI